MHTVDIIDGQMVVLDQDGNGIDMHVPRSYRGAKRQIGTWAGEFTIDVADACEKVRAYFVAPRGEEAPTPAAPSRLGHGGAA